ncbi:MAG TPA: hypothetical protein VIL36_05375 [Acidimicrobiales bacterium]
MPVPVAAAAAAAPAAAGSAAGSAVGAAVGNAARAAGQAAARAGTKAAGSTAKGAAKGASKATGSAAKGAGQTAAKGASQRAANAAQRARPPAGAPARQGRPTGRPGGRTGPGRGAPPARPAPQPGAPSNKAGKQGSKLPEKPGKQLRKAIDRTADGNRDGKDDKKRKRRGGPAARAGQRARKSLAKQARGEKEREPDAAEEAAEEVARRAGRRTKRLLFLDRDQFIRRIIRRSLLGLVLLSLLLLYPFLVLWTANASNTEPEEPVDDMVLMSGGLGPGPIPAYLLPVVAELTGIPLEALSAYSSAAGGEWPIDWRILAGIGKAECDHGRSTALYCSTPHNVWRTTDGGAGERGPMQHLGHLWRVGENDPNDPHVEGPPTPKNKDSTHVATDGDGDGIADPWNWYDAVHGAARKLTLYREELKAKGAAYDTDEFMIAAYNAGVGGATSNGSNIQNIPNRAYLEKVTAERDRIQAAVAHLGFVPGNASCPGAIPRGSTTPPEKDHITPATRVVLNNTVGCFGHEYEIHCYSPRDGNFEHPRGRACDFMISSGMPDSARRAHGTAMAEWHAANAQNLNVLYVIWYGRIWNSYEEYKPWSQWRPYRTCPTPSCGVTLGHFDHVHVSVKLVAGDPGWAHCPGGVSCSE